MKVAITYTHYDRGRRVDGDVAEQMVEAYEVLYREVLEEVGRS